MSSERAELLRSTPMFEGFAEADLEELAAAVTLKSFNVGQTIFRIGDAGNAMFILAEGQVNIFIPGEKGEKISLKDIDRGEFFGELALFDEKPRSASAVCTQATKALELTRDQLSSYIERHPRAAMAILRTMTERLRHTDALLSQRAAKNVDEDFDKNLRWADRLADKVAELNGSWAFIIFLVVFSGGWALVNSVIIKSAPDAYPYQFFNLLLAVLVALQGPLIVMSQNRSGEKDRARAETDYRVNLKNELNIETLLSEVGELKAELSRRLPAESAPPATSIADASRRS